MSKGSKVLNFTNYLEARRAHDLTEFEMKNFLKLAHPDLNHSYKDFQDMAYKVIVFGDSLGPKIFIPDALYLAPQFLDLSHLSDSELIEILSQLNGHLIDLRSSTLINHIAYRSEISAD